MTCRCTDGRIQASTGSFVATLCNEASLLRWFGSSPRRNARMTLTIKLDGNWSAVQQTRLLWRGRFQRMFGVDSPVYDRSRHPHWQPPDTGVCEKCTPFMQVSTLQTSSKSCSPAPDLALWRLVFSHLCFSGGVLFRRHRYLGSLTFTFLLYDDDDYYYNMLYYYTTLY